MQVDGRTISFEKSLWVQYGGVDVTEEGERIVVVGRDEDAFLKVFNHFGRVLKLFVVEGDRWIDTDTGQPAQPIDLSQAGHVGPVAGAPATGSTPAADSSKTRAGARRGHAPASAKSAAAAGAGRAAPRGKAKSPRAGGGGRSKSGPAEGG